MKNIHISELSKICATRKRAQEASSRLQPYLKSGVVEIDLDSVEILSTSFLDELILQLMKADGMEKVIFKCSTSIIEDKLARISGIRDAKVYYRFRNDRIHEITPKPLEPLKATFVATKPASGRQCNKALANIK